MRQLTAHVVDEISLCAVVGFVCACVWFRFCLSLRVFSLCLFLVLPAGCVLSCFPLCFLFLLLLRFRFSRLCRSPVCASASVTASVSRSSKVFRLGSPIRRDQAPASSIGNLIDGVLIWIFAKANSIWTDVDAIGTCLSHAGRSGNNLKGLRPLPPTPAESWIF